MEEESRVEEQLIRLDLFPADISTRFVPLFSGIKVYVVPDGTESLLPAVIRIADSGGVASMGASHFAMLELPLGIDIGQSGFVVHVLDRALLPRSEEGVSEFTSRGGSPIRIGTYRVVNSENDRLEL